MTFNICLAAGTQAAPVKLNARARVYDPRNEANSLVEARFISDAAQGDDYQCVSVIYKTTAEADIDIFVDVFNLA